MSTNSQEIRPPLLKGVSVLLVEDDDDSRELVERILRDQLADVIAVASGAGALAALETVDADVIVSDIGMREMDGYAFLAEVRRREEANGSTILPAISLTAFDGVGHMRRAAQSGFQRHLAKPFSHSDLVHAIADLAGRSQPGAR